MVHIARRQRLIGVGAKREYHYEVEIYPINFNGSTAQGIRYVASEMAV